MAQVRDPQDMISVDITIHEDEPPTVAFINDRTGKQIALTDNEQIEKIMLVNLVRGL